MDDNLRLKAIEDDTPSLVCEYDSLNRMMRDAYLYTLLRQGRAYHIMCNGEIVGGCMVKLTLISVEANGTEYSFPACEISYLVIDQRKRGQRHGTTALKKLILEINRWAKKIPIRYIVVEAFDEKWLVNWYKRLGFVEYKRGGKGSEYLGNKSMLMDLAEPSADFVSCNSREFSGWTLHFAMIGNADDDYTAQPHANQFPGLLLDGLSVRPPIQELLNWLKGIPIRFLITSPFPEYQNQGFKEYQGNERRDAVYLDFVNAKELERYADSCC